MEEHTKILKEIGLAIIFLPLSALFTAAILRWLNKKIAKFMISYPRAYLIEIIVGIANAVCCFAIILIGTLFEGKIISNNFLIFLIFLVRAAFYSKMIVRPGYGPIGWVKGGAYSISFGLLYLALKLVMILLFLLLIRH